MKKNIQRGFIFDNMPQSHLEEDFRELYSGKGFLIERIVSFGNTTDWLVQNRDEWVYICQGSALLEIEGEAEPVSLSVGNYLFIKANCRHRVIWTQPETETVWIAFHIDAS